MRAFVIGNGPSLNDTPLNRLGSEVTIGCNRFDLLGLDYEPTVWVLADLFFTDPWWDWDDLFSRDTRWVFREQDRHEFEQIGVQWPEGSLFMPRCKHIGGKYVPSVWHDYCEYGGSIGYALTTAVDLGASEVYVLGCDLYKYRPPGPDINHFDPDYGPYKVRKSTGEEVIGPERWENLNRRLIRTHELIRDWSPIPIYNATVGGSLDVYPRVDVNDVLNN